MRDETLLERILNGDEEPKDLPLAVLQSITNDFSQERKIGQGGFGAVYKGELQNGIIVAVKRIEVNQITIDDVSFRREFNSLMNTNHRNVVRFLGFCSNTHHIRIKLAGEINLVSVRERLLCFEYIRNGSLDKHITDELRGLEWEPRYAIISGICKGLFYLHEEKKIVHMDLKPPNILLDDHMVPKITDFGLSRSNEMSHTTGQRFGTPGYVAPEYEKDGKTSFKCDIYSLGVIITELVTGRKSVPHKNNVLRRWRHRWNKPPTLLQYRQVTRCIEISVRCRQQESGHRPSILEIVNILGESESMDGHTGQESAYLDDDMLRIEPLELKLNEEMSWSVKLTNKTKASFAFNIERPSQQYTIWPDKGIVTPGCNEYLVQITLQPQQRAPQVTQNADKIIFQSTKVPEGLRDEDITENIFHEEAGKVVDEMDLMIVYEPTKPKENCKSREDTNMPAEEVPEAKGRKIVESAFGKGKLGSSEKAEAASMAERIVGSLEDSTKDLIAKKNDVCQKIKNAERQGKKSTNEVDRWLEKVAKIIDVVHVISVECKLKKDVTMEASEKLREVQECLSSCPSSVAIESMPPPVQEMPGPSMSAEDLNLQEALRYIKDDPEVGMIGIWGPGGVGKTHLLNNINNSFGEGMDFDFVLFVTASRGCSVEKVQSQIIERLRLQSTSSNRLTIHEYMKTKSFLVLLDDLWNEINLEEVGIPYPLGNVKKLNRKVVLTTRLRNVCGLMKVKKELTVAYLQEHEAWQLFEENIGAETLSSPHIEALARELMKELKGLPLALITIGKAMYQKNEYQWETAIQYMKQSCCADDKDPIELGMETNVFKKLKLSYDNLRDDTLRACFLTCVLWPEDEPISKVGLAKCWMGLGLVNGPDIESSFRKSYSLIADLTAACLLEGCKNDDIQPLFQRSDGWVKVHDVIRDMALWISCDCGEKNEKWIVAAPGGRDQKVIMLSNKAECISLTSNTIPIRFNLDPINLRILCLRNNGLDESIIVEAIKNCSSLTYLDLRGNKLKRIPEELCSLVKLEYLDLSINRFWGIELPHSFGKLINLKFLYLESIRGLKIPAGVISSLKALQVIDLRGDISLPEWIFRELGTLPQLKALSIKVRNLALFESLREATNNLPVRYLAMQGVGAFTSILSTNFAQRTLYGLYITDDYKTKEITVEHDTEQPNTHFGALNKLSLGGMASFREMKWMGATPAFIFPRLTCLELFRCPNISHLSWAMYLPRLERLFIDSCNGVVQAFMRCHGDKLCNGQDKTKTFPCLRFLRLDSNNSLEAIGDKGMEFPSLERLEIIECPKLKRLPFQLDSLPLKLKELRFSDAQCWERLECEEERSLQTLINKNVVPVAAVVIMACNRPDYLQRTVESILKYQKAVASKFPLFISQDGTNGEVKKKALSYNQITFMQHVDLEPVRTERPGENVAYYKIANHYKWALDELFIKHDFRRVIILEDDMEIAPDFFDYFEAAAKLLDTDKSIMAVSSWNDNGQKQFVYDPKALYRSDFFPGLGWMLTKSTWMELSPKWPKAYWDDWVRLKEVHRDRQFIRPEVCRTYNFGEHGSSMGQFFEQYLKPIKLNDAHIDWNSEDLSYLKEDKFLTKFGKDVSSATPVHGSDALLKAHNMDVDVRIQYDNQGDFERIARQFGIFEEWKDGVPRAAYRGVVVFRYKGSRRRIYLVGPDSLRQLGV